jgi:hypothetical protein
MKLLGISIFAACLAASVACSAQESPRLSAGFIRVACNAHRMGAKDNAAVSICAMTIEGFIGGFTAGADRGASTALINDAGASETVKGINDLHRRLDAIRSKARCLFPSATVQQVRDIFLGYMSAHPESENLPFGVVAAAAVQDALKC